MNKVNSVRELDVYKAAFSLQQEIFRISKRQSEYYQRQGPILREVRVHGE